MRAFLICLVCAAAIATPVDNVDAAVNPPTITLPSGTTKYLKAFHRATLNFACNVERITVKPNFDSIAVGFEDPITQAELEDHIGEPSNIEWAHVMQMHFASTDSRGQDRQLGTLGGDLGEFLLVLAAIEQNQGKNFTSTEVLHKFKIYLTVMSKEKFYFSTSSEAINHFKTKCGCPQLNIADPPESKKDILMSAAHDAAGQGDEFFRTLLTNSVELKVRKELSEAVIDAFLNVMWKKSDPLHRRVKFVLLKGVSEPKGFIMVKTPGYCNAQLLAPMISPELCQKQMGIYHGDAAVLLRTEIAGILLQKTPESKNAVVRAANELASEALSKVLESHSEPVYTVSFEALP